MLEASYLLEITDYIENLFSELETEVLEDIARRISMNDYSMTSVANHQVSQLLSLGVTSDEINKIISEKLKVSKKYVNKIINESVYKSLESDNEIFERAYKDGLIPSFNYSQNMYKSLILSGIKATNKEISNICMSTAKTAQDTFIKATDKVFLAIKSGVFDYDTAITNAVKELSKKGLGVIEYGSGSKRRLDSAIRNAVRTGVNQTTLKCQDKNFEEMGGNLVITSSHAGARFEHALWQGQIFWRKKRVKGYKHFESATGYGTGAGLGGWNCRHSYYPYFEGLSSNPFEKVSLEENERIYNLTQLQRKNERMIREYDRRAKTCKAAGVDASKENAKLKEWRARQKELLIKNPELKRWHDREKGFISKSLKHKENIAKTMSSQLKSLTKEEKDVITKMSGALSQKINFAISHGESLERYNKEIALIDLALSKGKIPKEVVVTRKTIPEFLLQRKKYTDDDVFALKGLFISNEIYTSTSLIDFNYPLRNVIINMKLTKGFENALYIKDLATDQFKKQEEILLGRGLIYYVRDVVKKDNLFIITAEAIGYEG